MKKNSIIYFVLFVLFLFTCSTIRYSQCVTAIDYTTGFFYADKHAIRDALYIALVGAAAFALVFSILSRRQKTYFFKKRMGKIDPAETFILALSLIIAGGAYVYEAVAGLLSANNGLYTIMLGLGAVGYIVIGLDLMSRKRITLKSGLLCVIPAVFYTIRAVVRFYNTLVLSNMSDELIRFLVDVCMVLFFLALGRMFSRNETATTRITVNTLGFVVGVLVFSETLAKLFYWLTISDNMFSHLKGTSSHFLSPNISFVMDGAAVIVILILLHKLPYKDQLKNEKG